mgnify:FL=1
MALEITTEQFAHCDLVKATGRIDSQTAPQLAEAFTKIKDLGRHKIVLDLSGVEFISSAGLRVLINTQKECQQLGRGELVLAAVPERIYETLEIAGFLPLFTLVDDVLHAVGGF